MTDSRPARWMDNADGTKTLRVQCQGSDPAPDGRLVCTSEQRYEVTAEQLARYIEGADLAEIWDEPDAYLTDPWCDDHRPGA